MAEERATVSQRVLVLGGTGTIGLAAVEALCGEGHGVVCLARPQSAQKIPRGAEVRLGEAANPASLRRDGFRGERFDVLLSCMASRSGEPADAWAIDHRAHIEALAAARGAGVRHVVLLSAICVQKPRLAFQHAKLAFEKELIDSGLTYSIVRPTAYFKSLSGQIARVRQGKPFLVFGDGRLTATKPISDRDTGRFLAGCLSDPACHNRILPIGGPGEAITPRQQAELLFELLGQPPRILQVPVALLDAIVFGLSTAGLVSSRLRAKAELARIGRYYTTESMLVWDQQTSRYDAAATPSFGNDRLADHYRRVLAGEAETGLGAHSVF